MMKVLVTGAEGQVGRALMSAPPPGLHLRPAGRGVLDLTRGEGIARCLDAEAPDIVVNCAAYTAVDQAESEPGTAMAVNGEGAGRLAAACAEHGAALIHLSTDYVFDGAKAEPYAEHDSTAPINVYGASKLAGEAAVAGALAEHVILRTSWVYGTDGRNFVRTMLRLARERDEIRVVDDQRGCPTAASHIAEAIGAIALAIGAGAGSQWGLYHYRDDAVVTWHGFARRIFAVAGPRLGRVPRLVPAKTAAFPTAARRPASSVLDCRRIGEAFGIRPRPLEAGLTRHIGEILQAAAA